MKPKDSAQQPILPFDASAAPGPSPDAPDAAEPGGSSQAPPPPRTPLPSPTPAPAPAPSTAPSSPPRSAKRADGFLPEALLFLAAIVVLGVGLSSIPLLDPDEARYASASRAMLERGDLVVPYFNGAQRLNKPALFYWLQASSFQLFGTTAAAARIPSALAALGILVAVTLFARRTFGPDAGRRAGMILLTITLFAAVGKTGITDMTLALFTVGAMLLWYRLHIGDGGEPAAGTEAVGAAASRGTATSGARRRLLWLGVSLCLGLAFFVKGPVGILVPCFVIACYLAIRREWSGFRPRGILLGGAVALAVFLPWAGMLVYRLGAEVAGADGAAGAGLSSILLAGVGRVSELLRHETIDRTLHGVDHPEPLHYYWLASIVIFFPWIAWVPSAFVRVWPRLRRLEPTTLFLVTWIIGILVFFTSIRGKLVTYVLPAAPAIALLLGREWSRLRDDPEPEARGTRWIAAGSVVLVGVMIALAGYAAVASPPWLEGHFLLADGLALSLALAAAVPLLLGRPGAVNVSVAVVMAATLVAVPLIAGKAVGDWRSLEPLAHDAGFRERSWTHVIAYKMFRPSLVFYGGHDVTYIDTARGLHEALTPGCLVVLEQRRFDDLPPTWQSALRTVATQGPVLAMTPVIMLPEGNEPRGTPQGAVGDPAGEAPVPDAAAGVEPRR